MFGLFLFPLVSSLISLVFYIMLCGYWYWTIDGTIVTWFARSTPQIRYCSNRTIRDSISWIRDNWEASVHCNWFQAWSLAAEKRCKVEEDDGKGEWKMTRKIEKTCLSSPFLLSMSFHEKRNLNLMQLYICLSLLSLILKSKSTFSIIEFNALT